MDRTRNISHCLNQGDRQMTASEIQITKGIIYSQLIAPPDICDLVADFLAFRVKGADYIRSVQNMMWDGYIHLFEHRYAKFPAGLTNKVVEMLRGHGYRITIRQQSKKLGTSISDALYGITLYTHQKAVADKGIQAGGAILKAATGSGKTEIAAEIIRRIGLPTLWVVNRVSLLSQTAERLQKRLGIPIGIVGGGKEQVRLVSVGTVQTLINLPSDWFDQWDVLILDECHHASSQTWYSIARRCKQAIWRYGLSATPLTKDQLNDARLEGMTGPLIEEVTVDGKAFPLTVEHLANKGFLALPTIRILRPVASSYPAYEDVREEVCPTWRENPRQLLKLGGKLYAYTYKHGIMNNIVRSNLFVQTMIKHCQAGEKALMLCSRLDHGKALLANFRHHCTYPSWWLSGPDPDDYRSSVLNQLKRTKGGAALIASEIFREGIDLPEIDVLFLAGAGEAEIATLQHVGRALRKRPDKDRVLIYDSLDGRGPLQKKDYLYRHSQSRIATYRKEHWEIEESF